MCTGAEIPLIMTLVGTGVSVAGQIQQGKTQEAIDNRNATVMNYQASDALVRGSQEEQIQRQKVQQMVGTQTAVAGASGADVGSKSFSDVMTQTAGLGELDAQQIRMNAMREAWGFNTQAQGLRWQGQMAKDASTMGAIGTAITGFGKAYQMKPTAGGGGSGTDLLWAGRTGALGAEDKKKRDAWYLAHPDAPRRN
jgi:hypothetical protein